MSSEEMQLTEEAMSTTESAEETKELSVEDVENNILEKALNELNQSYSVIQDAVTKMSRSSSTRVLLAAISYPLDTKKLQTIQKDEYAQHVLFHAITCMQASNIISTIMDKRHNVKQEAIDNLQKEVDTVSNEAVV